MKLFRIIMALSVLVSAQNNVFGLAPRRGAQPAAPTQTGPKKGAPQKPGNTPLADLVDRALASNKSAKNLSTAQLKQLRDAFKGQIAVQSKEVQQEQSTALALMTPQMQQGTMLNLSNFFLKDGSLNMPMIEEVFAFMQQYQRQYNLSAQAMIDLVAKNIVKNESLTVDQGNLLMDKMNELIINAADNGVAAPKLLQDKERPTITEIQQKPLMLEWTEDMNAAINTAFARPDLSIYFTGPGNMFINNKVLDEAISRIYELMPAELSLGEVFSRIVGVLGQNTKANISAKQKANLIQAISKEFSKMSDELSSALSPYEKPISTKQPGEKSVEPLVLAQQARESEDFDVAAKEAIFGVFSTTDLVEFLDIMNGKINQKVAIDAFKKLRDLQLKTTLSNETMVQFIDRALIDNKNIVDRQDAQEVYNWFKNAFVQVQQNPKAPVFTVKAEGQK